MWWFDADGLHALGLGLLVGVERFAAAYCVAIVLRSEERAEFVFQVFHLLLLHYIIKGIKIKALSFGWIDRIDWIIEYMIEISVEMTTIHAIRQPGHK